MQQETLTLLEYPQVLQLFQEFTQTSIGREVVSSLRPLHHKTQLDKRLLQLEEALRYRRENGAVPLSHLEDPAAVVAEMSIEGRILEPFQFLLLADLLRLGSRLQKAFNVEHWPQLGERWETVPDLEPPLREIERVIDPSGEIRESADPELGRVRKRLAASRARVQAQLQRYFSGSTAKYLIQDPFITQRNNRYVIPIKIEHQNDLRGVVHAASSSGATVFLEPLPAVELNNECIYQREREQAIIHRILQRLTSLLRPHSSILLDVAARIGEFDALQACAEYAIRNQCVVPRVSAGQRLELREARHPLLLKALEAGRVVPVSMRLGETSRVLVISGPNTGGKTVALKTAGLFSLMAQSGLPVPALHAEFPLFHQILVDIGDNQSISLNQSTFSSHIVRITRMMDELEPPVLVLLDELGTGTDPIYGAALAIAILDHFRSHGVLLIATTHHHSVKFFAGSSTQMENASVELDAVSLRPTYALHFGVAGGSSAFEIAEQLGLPKPVIERARALLDEKELQLERYQTRLREEIEALEQKREELEGERVKLADRQQQLLNEAARNEEARAREAEIRLEELLDEVRVAGDRLVKGVKDRFQAASLRKENRQKQEQLKEAFRRRLSQARQNPSSEKSDASAPTESLSVGDWVYHTFFRKRGRIISLGEGEAVLAIDGKKVNARIEQLSKIEEKQVVRQPSRHVVLNVVESTDPELNLIGQTVDEALDNADKFLDRAFLTELHEVKIIHGFGKGKLRNALSSFLGRHPHVEHHQPEGGATIVRLKE